MFSSSHFPFFPKEVQRRKAREGALRVSERASVCWPPVGRVASLASNESSEGAIVLVHCAVEGFIASHLRSLAARGVEFGRGRGAQLAKMAPF